MAFVGKQREDQNYTRLANLTQPQATPTKRVGTEAPVGGTTAGPKAGQAPQEFTKSNTASPGGVFKRQLEGANIGGITSLAKNPLLREAGQESTRIAQEGINYNNIVGGVLSGASQFGDFDTAVSGLASGDEGMTNTAQDILGRTEIPVPELNIANVKEFSPSAALRGGSVEGILKSEAKGPYSTGMAGLDALLFAKKGGAADLANQGLALQATTQAAADALEREQTKKAQERAEELVKSQKEGLTAGIKKGLTGKEEVYTKADEGKKSKIQQEQERLRSEYAKSEQEAFNKYGQLKNQFQTQIDQALLQQAAARLFPDAVNQPFGILAVLSNPEMLAQLQNDPMYQQQKEKASQQIFSPFGAGINPAAQFLQRQEIPTLGLSNVISEEDAAAYNRLQKLIGGQEIKRQDIGTPKASLNEQAMRDRFNELVRLSELFKTPETSTQPLGSSFGGVNIPGFTF